MRLSSILATALAVLAATPFATAQALGGLTADLPSCGLSCLVEGIAASPCGLNQTCMCTDEVLDQHVTLCVTANCTVPESLVVKNITSTQCNAPLRNRSQEYANLTTAMAVVSVFLVMLRFAFKMVVQRVDLRPDDWAVLLLILTGTPSTIITSLGTTPNGLGRDIWTLTPTQITNVGYFFYFMSVLYFTQVCLLKLVVLFFYLQIFPSRRTKTVLWTTVSVTLLWGVLFVFLGIFQCWPVSYSWTKWDNAHEGRCLNINSVAWAHAIINVISDVWMLAIPMFKLKDLQLHWKKKISVAMMFFVGTFVTVVSIIRLKSIITFANSTNPTWDNLSLSIWSTIEINVGIFCACMPVLRLMLVRVMPVLASSYNRSHYANMKYGGGGSSSNSAAAPASSHHRRSMPLGGRMGPAGRSGDGGRDDKNMGDGASKNITGGIVYQKSFSVRVGEVDGDETSLVHMRDLDPKHVESGGGRGWRQEKDWE